MRKTTICLVQILLLLFIFAGCSIKSTADDASNKQEFNNTQETLYELSEDEAVAEIRNLNKGIDHLEYGTYLLLDKDVSRYEDLHGNKMRVETFCFDVSFEQDYCNEHYQVTYDFKIWERTTPLQYTISCKEHINRAPEFTRMGIWEYYSEDTKIWINLISREYVEESSAYKYEIEFEITHYRSTLLSSGIVTYHSNGVVHEYGNRGYDGTNDYLQIELEVLGDNEWIDAGYIAIYPNGGVYWNSPHDRGGPYKLQ
ncbi:MAG: hypothetical protein E7434_06935 [Ruminococcaceae bacterium]|nr:hypothetical protein [Oscillospiraceae bacterium]